MSKLAPILRAHRVLAPLGVAIVLGPAFEAVVALSGAGGVLAASGHPGQMGTAAGSLAAPVARP